MNTQDERKNVLQGTLDLLILRTVSHDAMHGWGIMQRLKQLTNDVFQVTPGSLFPALQRLEESGRVVGEWGNFQNNRKAKFYSITKAGRNISLLKKKTGTPSPPPSPKSWREHEPAASGAPALVESPSH